MSVKKTAYPMIAAFKVTVKSYPKFFPTIPSEFPGNFSASDSILSLLVRRDESGRSALFPLLAASGIGLSLSGAASPLRRYKKGAKAWKTKK